MSNSINKLICKLAADIMDLQREIETKKLVRAELIKHNEDAAPQISNRLNSWTLTNKRAKFKPGSIRAEQYRLVCRHHNRKDFFDDGGNTNLLSMLYRDGYISDNVHGLYKKVA